MRERTKLICRATLAVAILAGASNAQAFCRTTTTTPRTGADTFDCVNTGQPLYHPSTCVTYRTLTSVPGTKNVVPEQLHRLSDVLARVFATWTVDNERCNGISPVEVAPTTDRQIVGFAAGGPNANTIGFVDGAWPHGGGETLALTTLTFDTNTGEILDADVEISSQPSWVSPPDAVGPNDYDLESAMLHEAGHFLGLAHSTEPTAVMFASTTTGATNRALSPDDELAICTAYPNRQTRATGGGPLAATACDLTQAAAAPGCPGGEPDIKHGCAVGTGRSAPTAPAAWTAIVVLVLGLSRGRLRRAT